MYDTVKSALFIIGRCRKHLMVSMPFWKCYYHIVWATKYRAPVITPVYEPIIFAVIHKKSVEHKSDVLAVNAVSDHLHIAVAIPPSVSISNWVGTIKGATSFAVNQSFSLETKFAWQEGYGVLTFGEKMLPFVIDYIENQKTHHANNTQNAYLEQIGD